MIFEVQKYNLIFEDAFYSLAIGFLVGFINQFLAIFLFKNKKAIFVKDVLVSIVFAFLIFSYTVSFANYKVVRWYNILFAILGICLFSPCFSKSGHILLLMFSSCVVFLFRMIKGKILSFFVKKKKKYNLKRNKNKCEKSEENLKNNDILLYN